MMSSPRLSEVRSNGPITFQLNDFVTSDHSNGLADVSTLSYHPIWFVLSMRAPSDSALVAVGDVVFFMTLGHSTLNLIWDLTLTKLYSNCLLSTLNARASWNDLTRSVGPISDPMLVEQQGYELENAIKSFDVNSVVPRPDTDYGITVTKVFERMQDPRPSMRATQF